VGKIEEVRSLRKKAFEETKVLLQSARRKLIGDTPENGWIPLTRYIKEIENGWSPACESRPATGEEWGVLKLGAVSFGTFNENENKALPIN
jgi:type I restriction enzyme S subunit